MKTKLNPALMSKINWTQILLLIANVAGTLALISSPWLPHVLALINIVGPILTIVFRTYFTEPVS